MGSCCAPQQLLLRRLGEVSSWWDITCGQGLTRCMSRWTAQHGTAEEMKEIKRGRWERKRGNKQTRHNTQLVTRNFNMQTQEQNNQLLDKVLQSVCFNAKCVSKCVVQEMCLLPWKLHFYLCFQKSYILLWIMAPLKSNTGEHVFVSHRMPSSSPSSSPVWIIVFSVFSTSACCPAPGEPW